MFGQAPTPDEISGVTTAGEIKDGIYKNSYFGVRITIPHPNNYEKTNTIVASNRAMLLEVNNSDPKMEKRFNFAVVAHSANISGLTSTAQFVRSVRHQLEGEGLQTIRTEIPVTAEGHEFIESDLKMDSLEKKYFKAVVCTRIKQYIFGFWVEAPSEEKLKELVDLKTRIHFQ